MLDSQDSKQAAHKCVLTSSWFSHLFSSTWYSCLLSLWVSQSQSAGLAWPQPNSTQWGSGEALAFISRVFLFSVPLTAGPGPGVHLCHVCTGLLLMAWRHCNQFRENRQCATVTEIIRVSQFIIQIFGGKIIQPIHIMESPLFSRWGSMIFWCRSVQHQWKQMYPSVLAKNFAHSLGGETGSSK